MSKKADFEALVASLEKQIQEAPAPAALPKKSLKPKWMPGEGLEPKAAFGVDVGGIEAELLAAATKPSQAEVAAAKAKVSGKDAMYAEVKAANAAALVQMPAAPPDKWLVQVFPDAENILHFQAKSTPNSPFYIKWYYPVDQDTYDAVKAAFEVGSHRTSFYETSSKPYLICSREGETGVNIPGYGVIELKGFFGL